MNMIEAFKKQALRLSEAVTNAKEKQTLTNTLAWLAFFIESKGMLADKTGLKRLVAKGAECESAKAARSKALSVFSHLKDGNVITVEAKSYDLAYFKQFSADNLPDISLSVLYREMRKEHAESTFEALVEENATAALEAKHNLPLAEIQELLGSDAFNAEFDEAKADARKVLNAEAEAKQANNLADIKKAIAALSPEAQQEVAEYVIALLTPAQEQSEAA